MANMNMQQMMKQARKMQEQLAQAQADLAETTVEASAGGGMVKVKVNGSMMLDSITIDPDAVDPEDIEMLQDMIVAAVNEGIRQMTDLASKQMGSITGGLNIPGLF
ncbi:MAG TPA: YbaB/EbfC family nucleoid-associated protein [Collinsella ihuae]|uniref:Nucleoid-associated protein K8U80_10800 n=1 Tax=Collinsella ihumii TaxID=1720204 RepID=A0A921IQM7_9ACTN|nr:YbaB/EbfC family nucleoid-associated protein [Collinsella ihumii]